MLTDRTKDEDFDFFNLQPQDNYVGIEAIKPLEIDGKKVYLDQNELTKRTSYISGGVEGSSGGVEVCYANEKVMALYDDALSSDSAAEKKGILILDCSCPFVNVPGYSLKDKASAVQFVYSERGQDLIVITYSGGGKISLKLPNEDWDDETYRKSLIGNLLNDIDNKYGLDMPVIVFAYTKMCRGISYRSDKRVAT